jgi:hypothetical protein
VSANKRGGHHLHTAELSRTVNTREQAFCQSIGRASHGLTTSDGRYSAVVQVATQLATQLAAESCGEQRATGDDRAHQVVMLHTGGTMGIFGLAQRYPSEFSWADDEPADALL